MSIVSSAISVIVSVAATFTFLHSSFSPNLESPEPVKKSLRQPPPPCEPCARVDQLLLGLVLASFLFGVLIASAVCDLIRRRAYVHRSEVAARSAAKRRETNPSVSTSEVVVQTSVVEDLPRQTARVKVLRPSSKHGR